MKLWIIYSKVVLRPGKNNAMSWMLDEAKNCQLDAEILFTEDITLMADKELAIYHKGLKKDLPDLVLTRCYDMPLLQQFEELNIPVYNSSQALNDCLNKWRTHQLLVKNNIPTPKTIFSKYEVSYDFVKGQLGLPFITKDNMGAKGEQVFLVRDELTFEEARVNCSQPLYQEYIKSSFGRDVRLHVIGDQVVASVLRVSENDFKSNFSQGGKADFFQPDDQIIDLAVKSTKALGLDFSGIDVLFTEDGYTVCEVNGVPGFRTVGLTSKYNIPYAMMDYIRRKEC